MKEAVMTLSLFETRTGVTQTSAGTWLPAIAFRLWVRSDPKEKEQALPWVNTNPPALALRFILRRSGVVLRMSALCGGCAVGGAAQRVCRHGRTIDSGGVGLLGGAQVRQEQVRPLQLHSGRDAPCLPVLDALDAAILGVAQQLGDLDGTAKLDDERPIGVFLWFHVIN